MRVSGPLLREIRVVNFRSARRLVLRPGPICALIGEPGAGKSNALFAVRALLDPRFDLTESTTLKGGVGRYSQPPLKGAVASAVALAK